VAVCVVKHEAVPDDAVTSGVADGRVVSVRGHGKGASCEVALNFGVLGDLVKGIPSFLSSTPWALTSRLLLVGPRAHSLLWCHTSAAKVGLGNYRRVTWYRHIIAVNKPASEKGIGDGVHIGL